MTRSLFWGGLVSLLFATGCSRLSANVSRATFQPGQLSANDINAAEPVTASGPDGGFYVAWVNHDADNQSDVMLARFMSDRAAAGTPVRVNAQAGVASAWRGDPPSVEIGR